MLNARLLHPLVRPHRDSSALVLWAQALPPCIVHRGRVPHHWLGAKNALGEEVRDGGGKRGADSEKHHPADSPLLLKA